MSSTRTMETLIACCAERPHGTDDDEYCTFCGGYHWEAPGIDVHRWVDLPNGEDIEIVVGGETYRWTNKERTWGLLV